MNCRAIEPLLLAERDGGLTATQRTALGEHLANCDDCRKMQTRLAEAMTAIQTDVAGVRVPDVNEEWQNLQARMRGAEGKRTKAFPLTPILWFGAPLAAAAAVALAFFIRQPSPAAGENVPLAEVASAEFVEAGDTGASTVVYVDKDSGWLVVWASDSESERSG